MINFCKVSANLSTIHISGEQLETVKCAKILGLTISNDLKWTDHVLDIINKANKRIYFIIQLKRAKVPARDIISIYCSCLRPVLEYGSQVFHYALLTYLSDSIERVQKRIPAIVHQSQDYDLNLQKSNLDRPSVRLKIKCISEVVLRNCSGPGAQASPFVACETC